MSEAADRWTVAAVYPDMWVDPDEDLRNNDGPSPDGELATYLDYLESYRLTLLMKCDGLDPEQLARRSVPPSTMSLLGLVRHLAEQLGGGSSLRELWVHRIEEYARHCGHADLLRECVDGRVGQ